MFGTGMSTAISMHWDHMLIHPEDLLASRMGAGHKMGAGHEMGEMVFHQIPSSMTDFRKALIECDLAAREPLRRDQAQPDGVLLPPPQCFDPKAPLSSEQAIESTVRPLSYGCLPSTVQELYCLLGPKFSKATEELENLIGIELSSLPLSGEICYRVELWNQTDLLSKICLDINSHAALAFLSR